MTLTHQIINEGSLEDSETSDDTDLAIGSAASNSYFGDSSRRDSGWSEADRYFEEDRNQEKFQLAGMFVPCIDATGSGCADPFQTLPSLPGGDTEALTHHWHTVFVNTTTPPGPRRRWFPYSIADPALFHGIMHISAAHLAGSQRSKPSAAYFQHRGEVIRLISKRITNSDNATSDGTISAIACLLISDSMSGHPERARAHITGIQQLVATRGGISCLDPLTQKLVRWVSLLVSITSLERPIFCPPQMLKPNLNIYYGPPSLSTKSYALAFCTRLINFTSQQEPSQLSAKVFWGLRNLSVLKESANMAESLTYESVSYSDRVECIERQTETLLHDTLQLAEPGNASRKPISGLIFTLYAYATLIYINLVFRELVPCFITTILAQRLELAMDIEDAELNILLGTFPELTLWILFLGGGAARSKSKIWFAKTASRILRLQKLEEQAGIIAASTLLLWPEGRENYDDSTGNDHQMADMSEVEIAFASVLPSIIPAP